MLERFSLLTFLRLPVSLTSKYNPQPCILMQAKFLYIYIYILYIWTGMPIYYCLSQTFKLRHILKEYTSEIYVEMFYARHEHVRGFL